MQDYIRVRDASSLVMVKLAHQHGYETLGHVRTVLIRPLRVGLGLGLEDVFVVDSKTENRDRAAEAVTAVSEARAV